MLQSRADGWDSTVRRPSTGSTPVVTKIYDDDDQNDGEDGDSEAWILFKVNRQCRLSLWDIEMSMGQCFVFLVTGPDFRSIH